MTTDTLSSLTKTGIIYGRITSYPNSPPKQSHKIDYSNVVHSMSVIRRNRGEFVDIELTLYSSYSLCDYLYSMVRRGEAIEFEEYGQPLKGFITSIYLRGSLMDVTVSILPIVTKAKNYDWHDMSKAF